MATSSKGVFDVDAFLATVSEGISVINSSKGQAIFLQGGQADALFYIQKGKIKITTVSRHGKEAVVAILSAGDFFGEGCLTGQPRRISTATAMVNSLISRLDKAKVIRSLHDQPDFTERFLAYLLARNSRMESDLMDQLFNSSEKRLARLLLLLANFGKEDTPEPVVTNVDHETLAEMIGTTRSKSVFSS